MNAATECSRCQLGHWQMPTDLEYQCPVPKHLLQTNEQLRPSEESSMLEILANTRSELSLLDQEIKRVKQVWKTLMDRKELLRQSVLDAKKILSPIRRIPSEIIAEIILHSLGYYIFDDDDTMHWQATSMNTRKGIWIFSHVSRIWRAAALSLPVIWANISIKYLPKDAEPSAAALNLLQTILARAKLCSLRIEFVLDAHTSDVAKELLRSLVRVSSQWRDVRLEMHSKFFQRLAAVKGRLPLLESIHVEQNSNNSETRGGIVATPLNKLFQTAPSLRSLTCIGFKNTGALQLPWAQLNHYRNNEPMLEFESIDVLEQMPNLCSLWIEEANLDASEETEGPELPYLRKLTCQDGGLLPFLTAPSLEEVSLGSHYDIGELVDFIERSSCNLTTLSFTASSQEEYYHHPVGPALSIFFLKAVPGLTTLSLCNKYLDVFLSPLIDDPSSHLLPKLLTLIFSDNIAMQSADTVVKTINSRWKSHNVQSGVVARLRKVRFNPQNIMSPSHVKIFKTLRKEGLDITIPKEQSVGYYVHSY